MDQQTLEQFNKDKEALLTHLRNDPRTFALTLYSEHASGPFWKRTD